MRNKEDIDCAFDTVTGQTTTNCEKLNMTQNRNHDVKAYGSPYVRFNNRDTSFKLEHAQNDVIYFLLTGQYTVVCRECNGFCTRLNIVVDENLRDLIVKHLVPLS